MNISQMKGFVAEEVAKYHIQKLEYNVVPIGREKIEPELSDLLIFIRGNMNHLNSQNKNSFQLFENTISKLPDYAIWKTTSGTKANVMTFRFLEVKYRAHVSKLKKHDTEEKYSLNIQKADDENELSVHKYIQNLQNLQNLHKISSKDKTGTIDSIEFYIYLVTLIDGKHTPLIGKIATSKYSDFYTYLYTPQQLACAPELKSLWGADYDLIANFFMADGRLDTLFGENFLIPLLGKTDKEIAKCVHAHLQNELKTN